MGPPNLCTGRAFRQESDYILPSIMEFRLEIVIPCDSVRSQLVISTWHVMMHEFKSEYLIPEQRQTVQRCTLWCAPGSVNVRRKNCVLLPGVAWRMQLFTCSDLRSCQVYGSKSMVFGVRSSPVSPALHNFYMHSILRIFGHLDS